MPKQDRWNPLKASQEIKDSYLMCQVPLWKIWTYPEENDPSVSPKSLKFVERRDEVVDGCTEFLLRNGMDATRRNG